MSTISANPSASTASVRPRLAGLTASHFGVDFLSMTFMPILSVLEGRVGMDPRQGALMLAFGGVASGLVQPVVAWYCDRRDSRLAGIVGFALAAVGVALLPRARTFEHLLVLQLLAGLGIGAFHPVAAAGVGSLGGARRVRGLSVFYAAGIFGGICGSVGVPAVTGRLGVEAVSWLFVPAAFVVLWMGWAIRGISLSKPAGGLSGGELTARERAARWRDVLVLYAGNVLRFSVNTMLVQLVIRWAEGRARARMGSAELTAPVRALASQINGPMQAFMQVGMGVSGLVMGLFLARLGGRRALVWIPCVGSLAIAAFPHAPGRWMPPLLMALGGVGFAAVMPMTLAMAQRLLPHRATLASGLMMGGAWGIGAAGLPAAQWMLDAGVSLERAFLAVGAVLLLSGLLGLGLRRGTGH